MGDLMNRVPRLHPEVRLERADGRLTAIGPEDSVHTFDDDSGEVSEVAERIVELSEGFLTVSEIVDVLCDEFEVTRDVCAPDTEAFVQLLVDQKVLVLG